MLLLLGTHTGHRGVCAATVGDTHWPHSYTACVVRYGNNNNNNNNHCQRRYWRFFTIFSQRRELSPTRTLKWPERSCVQITCNTLNAYHVQVSCHVPLGTKGQLSY